MQNNVVVSFAAICCVLEHFSASIAHYLDRIYFFLPHFHLFMFRSNYVLFFACVKTQKLVLSSAEFAHLYFIYWNNVAAKKSTECRWKKKWNKKTQHCSERTSKREFFALFQLRCVRKVEDDSGAAQLDEQNYKLNDCRANLHFHIFLSFIFNCI